MTHVPQRNVDLSNSRYTKSFNVTIKHPSFTYCKAYSRLYPPLTSLANIEVSGVKIVFNGVLDALGVTLFCKFFSDQSVGLFNKPGENRRLMIGI